MRRAHKVVNGLFALVLLAALLGGIPWALWHYVGWPLPRSVPSWSQFSAGLDQHGIPDEVLLGALACVVWLTWAILVVSVLVEVPAALRGRAPRHVAVAGPLQPLVGHLVAAILVATLALVPRPAGDSPAHLGTTLAFTPSREPAVTLFLASDVTAAPAPKATNGTPASAPAAAATTTYVVQRGDTLWGIADRELGDPLRWRDIFALNDDRPEPGGEALTDPHWIYPGWTILLPAAQSVPAPPATAAAAPDPVPQAPPGSTSPAVPPVTAVPTTTTPSAVAASNGREPRAGVTGATVMAPRVEPAPTDHRRPAPASITLSSGSRLGAAFATGVFSAMAAGRLRRRRRYRPRSPRPGRPLDPQPHSAGLQDLITAMHAARHHEDEEFITTVAPAPPPLTATPDQDALSHPDLIEVASREGEILRLGLCDWPGLTLSGPGAEAAVRAWLAALLTRNGPYGAEILVTNRLHDGLFPSVDLPSLQRIESLEAALTRLETAVLGRTRRLEEADVPDVVTYRRRSPEDPFPLLLVVTEPVPESLAARWRASLTTASHLGLADLVLDQTHSGNPSPSISSPRLVVGEGGSLQDVTPRALADLLVGSRLFELTAGEAVDLLAPIADVHHDPDPEPDPHSEIGDSSTATTANGSSTSGVSSTDVPFAAWPTITVGAPGLPIRVAVLGPGRVEAWGEEVKSGLRSAAYELLAWYGVHPGGATSEAAIEALWPDASPKRGRERFWTALGNLRSRLRGPADDGIEILTKVGNHYRPDPAALDLDLWRFEAALVEAACASGTRDAAGPLERATTTYAGDFYPTGFAIWVEPIREDLHRRALDAHLRLSEVYRDAGRSEEAIAMLERAIELDSICEDAYRRLMSLQAALGRHHANERTWRVLQGHLAELDLEPETTTVRLVHEVIAPRPTSTGRRLR